LLRQPAPPSTSAEWKTLSSAAVAYRVLDGGRALRIAASSEGTPSHLHVDMRGFDSDPVPRGRYHDAFCQGHSCYRDHPLQAIVQGCYETAVRRIGAGKGVLVIEVRLDESGALTGTKVTGTDDAGFRTCVTSKVKGLDFHGISDTAVRSARYVGYSSKATGFGLELLPEEQTLVKHVRFEGSVEDIYAKGRRIKVKLSGGSKTDLTVHENGRLR
jgi:hypothetical protein